MLGFTFISNAQSSFFRGAWALGFALLALMPLESARAQTPSPTDEETGSFLNGPFSEYGEFENDDEESDEKFFQYGRFFGVGLGLGITSATGNAGQLYQGGFPTLDFRLNYWFDFLVALQLNVKNSIHNYDVGPDGQTATNLFRLLAQIKYYFDTKDLAAPITFIAPHLILGGGMYQRTDNMTELKTTESSSAFGLNFGVGFELTIKPKKFYLQIETTANVVSFGDAYDPKYDQYARNLGRSNGIPDRTGMWLDTVVALMWTW